jgi:NADPH2:quinone reductase
MSPAARAARLVAHSKPLVIRDVDLPDPVPGEVLVDMAYGGVNPVDRYNALGRVAAEVPLPRTLGSEGSGVVGERRVLVRGRGLWATAAVVPESAVVDVPIGVGLAEAAALGVAGVTAWRCTIELAAVVPEDRVLVLGASGGVGSMIVSLAHHLGAAVCGQTASPAKAEFLRGLGADRVVVGESRDLPAELNDFQPTVVFDPLGDGYTAAALEAMEPRGRLILFGTSADVSGLIPLQALYRKSLRVLGYGGLMESEEALTKASRAALEALNDGRFKVTVDAVLPLERANEAFERLVDRSVSGKLLLDLRHNGR